MRWRTGRVVLVIVVMTALSVGTVSGQVRINSTNARIAQQALAGQRGLDRQCALLPVGKKLYAWALANTKESKFTPEDYDLVVSTATTACSDRP